MLSGSSARGGGAVILADGREQFEVMLLKDFPGPLPDFVEVPVRPVALDRFRRHEPVLGHGPELRQVVIDARRDERPAGWFGDLARYDPIDGLEETVRIIVDLVLPPALAAGDGGAVG